MKEQIYNSRSLFQKAFGLLNFSLSVVLFGFFAHHPLSPAGILLFPFAVISAVFLYLLFVFLEQRYRRRDEKPSEDFKTFFSEYLKDNLFFCKTAGIAILLLFAFIACVIYEEPLRKSELNDWNITLNLSSEEVWNCVVHVICFTLTLASLKMMCDYSDTELADSQSEESSIGSYWALGAYDTYYSEKLQDILKRIEMFEEKNKMRLYKKLVLICPLSCNIEGSLKSRYPDIEHVGDLEPIEIDAGANMNRIYKSPVYRVDSEYDRFYITAEFPSPLGTLWKEKDTMNPLVLNYHRDCFLKCLRELIRPHNCVMWEYDDLSPACLSLHEFLLSKLDNTSKERTCINVDKEM